MILHCLNDAPEVADHLAVSYGDTSYSTDSRYTLMELDEWDTKYLYGVEEAWYWYASGDYEGIGAMIARKEGQWLIIDLGHCSCYGPTGQCDTKALISHVDEATASDVFLSDFVPLFGYLPSTAWSQGSFTQ